MAADQELQVQNKRQVESKEESTMPARLFLPQTDIFETSEALTLVLEMPGVDKGSVEVKVENDVLNIEGRVDFSKYDGLQPLYTEYNVGHYARSFRLSSKIEQDGISAELKDGVMTLVLPKAEKAKAQNQSKLSTSGSWLDALTCNLLKIVEGVVIPIRPFLAGQAFDPETIA
jgi:HSP20 family molecular chaperone IbpA